MGQIRQEFGVGFSAAVAITSLSNKNDQLCLFSAVSDLSISESDVREIVAHYKKYQDNLTIEEAIKQVTDARPKISNTFIVVISISEESKAILNKNAMAIKKQPHELLKNLIKKKLKISDVNNVQLKGNNIAIGLKEAEYRQFKKQISQIGLEYDGITQYIVD